MPDLTLDSAPLGEAVVVTAAAVATPVRRRLIELGLRPGVRVTVLRRAVGGSRVVQVDDARVAVDRRTAQCVGVQVVG